MSVNSRISTLPPLPKSPTTSGTNANISIPTTTTSKTTSTPTTVPPSPTKKTFGPGPGKITILSVLAGEHSSPFSFADFADFVKREHSEENLEFYQAAVRFREKALPLLRTRRSSSRNSLSSSHSGGSLASVHSIHSSHSHSIHNTMGGGLAALPIPPTVNTSLTSPTSDDKEAKIAALKDDLDTILTLYLTPGSNKEVNIPDSVRKRIMLEVREKKILHPDVLKPAAEHILALMKLSSFPNFVKQGNAIASKS